MRSLSYKDEISLPTPKLPIAQLLYLGTGLVGHSVLRGRLRLRASLLAKGFRWVVFAHT